MGSNSEACRKPADCARFDAQSSVGNVEQTEDGKTTEEVEENSELRSWRQRPDRSTRTSQNDRTKTSSQVAWPIAYHRNSK